MAEPVYLDYNATTPIDPEVAYEMLPYIQTFFGNPSSSYAFGRSNKEAIHRARIQVAGLIHVVSERKTAERINKQSWPKSKSEWGIVRHSSEHFECSV
jgi:selenocysteine lyase/cysteine desulfurase